MTQVPPRYEPIALSPTRAQSSRSSRVRERVRETAYESEAELERSLIAQLQQQACEHLRITSEAGLIANLRRQLEKLNKSVIFSDAEWQRFLTQKVASANDGIIEKTKRIQEDHIQVLARDDGSIKNVYLIDKKNIHNNRLQVINQYEAEGRRANRYDATVLVNGLPMVHARRSSAAASTSVKHSTRSTDTSGQFLVRLRVVRVSATLRHQ